MGTTRTTPTTAFATVDHVKAARQRLWTSRQRTAAQLRHALEQPGLLPRMKFQPLGADPVEPERPLNIIEQINQDATWDVALDAVDWLLERHPGRRWAVQPGASGRGPDITSEHDRVVIVAEVFAAVAEQNNAKLKKDLARLRRRAPDEIKYVFLRTADSQASEIIADGVTIVRFARSC